MDGLRAKPWGWTALAIVAWATIVASGFAALEIHANRPGESGKAPVHHPEAKSPHLFVFLHPKCPCSQATVAELDRIASSRVGALDTTVYLYAPRDKGKAWAMSGLFDQASRIPGCRVVLDENGLISRKMGARTSGQTVLYGAKGDLIFSGGITASRGHEGDSVGKDSILSYCETGKVPIASAPVFGCSLGLQDVPNR